MADAEGLRSVMEQLRNLMPLIPERVEGVAEKGSELRKAAESVVHDYKEVQGTKQAMKFKVKRDGKPFIDGEATEIVLSEKLDASIFAKP